MSWGLSEPTVGGGRSNMCRDLASAYAWPGSRILAIIRVQGASTPNPVLAVTDGLIAKAIIAEKEQCQY